MCSQAEIWQIEGQHDVTEQCPASGTPPAEQLASCPVMRAQAEIWQSGNNDEHEKLKLENKLLRSQMQTRWVTYQKKQMRSRVLL